MTRSEMTDRTYALTCPDDSGEYRSMLSVPIHCTREAYEALCAKRGWQPVADTELGARYSELTRTIESRYGILPDEWDEQFCLYSAERHVVSARITAKHSASGKIQTWEWDEASGRDVPVERRVI